VNVKKTVDVKAASAAKKAAVGSSIGDKLRALKEKTAAQQNG
jgi:hypothetical protein